MLVIVVVCMSYSSKLLKRSHQGPSLGYASFCKIYVSQHAWWVSVRMHGKYILEVLR